ncbi:MULTISPECIES: asparagine synthase family protein [unclassified Sphingobium]|uniref:asparagine synthase-related protein n=1 Tax=unclassified Sphingobium TaxID=2611147 RepID=UPI0022245412|nr:MULTISPECIES: asparagine synthetase B family protein [unclassified Sphingobium]MCW2384642.1 asparagine synthase (glutamine-hydrolyzing) [Sphingobium sp. B2D3D]
MTRFWGGYLAVWAQGNAVVVMRDPSGLLPCCYLVNEGYVVFASDPAMLFDFQKLKPSIDWNGIARLLFADDLAQARTGLAGVTDLLAGHLAIVADDGCSAQACWSPLDHVAADENLTANDQVERLGRIVDQCVRSWASSFQRPLLAVSGGLDSSVVAACLDKRQSPECITLATADLRGNETEYARALCESLDLPLAEFNYQIDDADIMKSAVAHLARPGARTPMVAYDAAVIRHAAQIGGKLFLTGAGGDNVFYLTHSVRPLVDRYLSNGFSLDLMKTASDISSITETTISKVILHAIRFAVKRPEQYQWRYDRTFLHSDILKNLERTPPTHAWLEGSGSQLPGKSGHIAMIARAQQYLHGYDRRLPFTSIAPLLSQPVVEVALGIPSWTACEGGMDRSVARRAFAARLPTQIIQRRTKGGPDAFAIDILRTHLKVVRDRLLGGKMAQQGLLDMPSLEAALRLEELSRGANYVRLLLLVDTEAWIDGWDRFRPTI